MALARFCFVFILSLFFVERELAPSRLLREEIVPRPYSFYPYYDNMVKP